MILIGAHEIGKSFTAKPLFNGLTFSIESGERIGLIGPNGAGKSTLMKVLAGQLKVDEGRLSLQKGLRVGFLEQVPSFQPQATIIETVLQGAPDPDDWEAIAKSQELMSRLGLNDFPSDMNVNDLSGGWKKRVALARELVKIPDLLLLDEPTNHLDVESILWLEEFLAEQNLATVTITHDRLFLQRIANRIIELDRRHKGGLLSVKGSYLEFLESREQLIAAQETQETKLKNTLRRETEWLRRGAKARQTKQTARINAAKNLSDEVQGLTDRNRNHQVRLDFKSAEAKPKRLIEASGVSKNYQGKVVVPKMDLLISPKSRIGLMGRNGCGKSTLIKILTKNIEPDTGSVFHADALQIAYFEQNRETLDPKVTVQKTVCPFGENVDFAGQNVHVRSYLSRFLFNADQMNAEVGKLSGGEQSRLLLARLMLRKANLLILDEPTNDLDIATLDVLGDVLTDFDGAIVMVTHDRYFLDQMTSTILAFGQDESGNKTVTSMAGLAQWEVWYDDQLAMIERAEKLAEAKASANANQKSSQNESAKKRKISYKEQLELDGMESKIAGRESELQSLKNQLVEVEKQNSLKKIGDLQLQIANLETEILELYERWQNLQGTV